MVKRILPGYIPQNAVLGVIVAIAILLLGYISWTSIGVRNADSTNFNSRISIVVIHFTSGNFQQSFKTLTKPSCNSVSSHYLIPEPGDASYGKLRVQTYQLVPEPNRAWHAGISYWAGKTGLNDQSIGIELVNQAYCHTGGKAEESDPDEESTDNEPFDPASCHSDDEPESADTGKPERICFYPDFDDSQIALLVDLLEDITERHPKIRPTHIIGHSDIAPNRKIDPGPRFPWQRLARLGYGAWYDDETVIRYWERFRLEPLPLVNVQKALHAYGYNIEPTGEADEQTANVVRAFQLHFRPSQVTSEITAELTAVLFALMEKYYPRQLEELLSIKDEKGDAKGPQSDTIEEGDTKP